MHGRCRQHRRATHVRCAGKVTQREMADEWGLSEGGYRTSNPESQSLRHLSRHPCVKGVPHQSLLDRSVILGFFSPQDDATLKCWGRNNYGQLGLGDTYTRGDDANGHCPPNSTTASLVPAPRVLTLTPALRVQGWGRTSLRSTWGLGKRP